MTGIISALGQEAAETEAQVADSVQVYSVKQVRVRPDSVPSEAWSFDDCVNWASQYSTEVRRSILNVLEKDVDIASAKDAWLPSVGFTTSQTFSNSPFVNGAQQTNKNVYGSQYNINANWTVWEGNARKYRLQSNKLLRNQEQLAGDNVVHTLKLGLLQAYLNILYAREAVTVATQTLEVSTSQAERGKRLMESGRTSKVDYAQIETQRAQDAYSLVQAENNLESAKMTLKQILQLGLDYNLTIADVNFDDTEVLCTLPAMSDTYSSAMAWLPEIRSNELNKEIYANDVKIAKAGRLPQIDLSGGVGTGYTSGLGTGWSTSMKRNFGENIGLTVSIPIFDGNSTKRAVAKARLSELQYDLNRKNLLANLSQTVENLYIDANNARAKYQAGLTQLNSAQLTADLANRQFELGKVNTLELLTAHNNLLNARLEVLMNKYMAIMANKTILYYATQEMTI